MEVSIEGEEYDVVLEERSAKRLHTDSQGDIREAIPQQQGQTSDETDQLASNGDGSDEDCNEGEMEAAESDIEGAEVEAAVRCALGAPSPSSVKARVRTGHRTSNWRSKQGKLRPKWQVQFRWPKRVPPGDPDNPGHCDMVLCGVCAAVPNKRIVLQARVGLMSA